MHAHNHSHSHTTHVSDVGRSMRWAVGLNLGYAVFEGAAGLYIGSLAVLSDAGHNLSDVVGLLLSMLGLALARRAPTYTYTYGFGKGTILVSLANALLLLVAMGAVAYGAIERFHTLQQVPGLDVAWIAGLGIAVNTGSALLFLREQSELNARLAFLHLAADAGVSAAVVLAGVAMAYYPVAWLDPAMSLLVAAVVVYSTWSTLKDSLRMSMDGVPPGMHLDELEKTIRSVKGVTDVHHIHVWPLSTTQTGLTAHIQTSAYDIVEIDRIKHAVKHALEHAGIHHSTLEFERVGPCADDDHHAPDPSAPHDPLSHNPHV